MLRMYKNALWYGGSIAASSQNPYFPAANIPLYPAYQVWRSGTVNGTETLTITLDRAYANEAIYLVLHGFDFSGCSAISYSLGAGSPVALIGWTNGQAFVTQINVAASINTLTLTFTKTASSNYVQCGKIFVGNGFDNNPIDEPGKGGFSHTFFEEPNKDTSVGGQDYTEPLYQKYQAKIDIPYLSEIVMEDTERPFLQAVGVSKPFFIVVDNSNYALASTLLAQVYYVRLETPPEEKWIEFSDIGYMWAMSLDLTEQL